MNPGWVDADGGEPVLGGLGAEAIDVRGRGVGPQEGVVDVVGEVAGHVDRSPGGGSAPLDETDLMAKLAGNVGPPALRLAAAVRRLPTASDLAAVLHLVAAASAPEGVRGAGPSRPTEPPEA